jgi:hypothetical protein
MQMFDAMPWNDPIGRRRPQSFPVVLAAFQWNQIIDTILGRMLVLLVLQPLFFVQHLSRISRNSEETRA